MNRTKAAASALCVFLISFNSYAVEIGDIIVKKVACRSGAPVNYLNTVAPGKNLGPKRFVQIPRHLSSVISPNVTSYRDSRPPCPEGDAIEGFAVEVVQIQCLNQPYFDRQNAEKIADLDFTNKIEIIEENKPSGAIVLRNTEKGDTNSPCPMGDTFVVRLSPTVEPK